MGQPKRSVLLVELSDLRQIPGKTSAVFPLLGGLYHEQAIASHWIRFGIGLDEGSSAAAGGVELCPEDFQRLCQATCDYEATEVLLSEPLTADQTERLAQRSPEAVLGDASHPATLTELAAVDPTHVEPRYEWDPGNAAVASKHMDVVHLTLQPPVAWLQVGRDWIERQVAGIRRSRPGPHGYPRAVALEEIQTADQVAACIAALRQHQLEEHIELWIALHAGKVPEVAATIRGHFVTSPASRLRVVVHACTVDRVAPSELAPDACATTVLDGLRCINELRELAQEHRGRFWYRGLDLGLDRGLLRHFELREWETARGWRKSTGVDTEKTGAAELAVPETKTDGPRTYWFGDQRVGLAELLRRLTPLVRQDLKPVLAIAGITRADLRGAAKAVLEEAGTAHRLVNDRADAGQAERVLLVAREEDALHQAGAALRGLAASSDTAARRDALHRVGMLFGYPECCVREYATQSREGERPLAWSAFARRANRAGSIPPSLRPLLVPTLGFVPCSAGCATAAASYSSWFELLGRNLAEHAAADAAEWFALDGNEHVALRVVRRDEDSLHYDPSSAAGAAGPTGDWLRAGDRLRFASGQIQVWRGDALLGTCTATHGVWDPARCWDAATWRELCRGILTRQLAAALPPTQLDWGLRGSPRAGVENEVAQPDHSRFCERVEAALRTSADSLHARTGYAVRSVTTQRSGVRVLLNDGADRLDLWVEPARSATQAFRCGQWVAITHSPDSPVDTQDQRAAVAQLFALLEKAR